MNTDTNIEKEKLTPEEVVETLEALERAFSLEEFSSGYRLGAYSPMVQNQLVKSLNVSTSVPNKSDIESALNNPAENEDKLVSFGQSYYFSSLMYKRNQEYLATLPSFDLELSCTNASGKDYESAAYKKDYKVVVDFLDRFNYREQFKDALWNMLMNETYYCMFREFDTKSVLQTWPSKFAQISGKFEYGLLYDADMSYFLQPQVDINLYPDWCKKKYLEMFGKGNQKEYIPSNKINKRTGSFATWAQTDPAEGFWCFKFNNKHNLQVPFFSAMLPEMAIVPVMRNLQVNQSMAAARKLLVSSIPYLNDKRSASVANQLAINADVLGKFIGLASKGLEEAIKVLALPTENIQGVEFENTDQDTYSNFMTITSSLLSGGKVIFSTNERQNVIETQLSLNLDELLVESIYPQFENFLEFYINKKTKKFKWKFRFVGSNDQFSRERRQAEVFTYADKGVVLPNKIASSLGLNKIELERELDEAKATGFTDKLMTMLNINTMASNSNNVTNNDKQGGRPKSDNNDLTDSAAETRGKGSNIGRGGKL